MQIIDISQEDLEAFLSINNAAVPNVNHLERSDLKALIDQAFYAKQVQQEGVMAAFLLVLAPGADYQSQNYQWFSRAYDAFAYVDRIVVAESHRGMGFGGLLYKDLFKTAQALDMPRICCEVNSRPPNPGSSAFHAGLGFISVGTQETENGTKEVDLLVKDF